VWWRRRWWSWWTLGTFTMPAQFILSVTEFLVHNLTYFSLNGEIHNKLTINR
jgi:hypothetical protein